MESESQVTCVSLHTLLEFLKLCEERGCIKFLLSFSQIQESIKPLWDGMSGKVPSDECPGSPAVPPLEDTSSTSPDNESHPSPQTPLTVDDQSVDQSDEMHSFLDVKTPEMFSSTPLLSANIHHTERTQHASSSLSVSDERFHSLSTEDDRLAMKDDDMSALKEKRVNEGSYVAEECIGRGETETSTSGECDKRDTSQIPLFDLGSNTDNDNDDSNLEQHHQNGSHICTDEHCSTTAHTDGSYVEHTGTREPHCSNHDDGGEELELKKSCDYHVIVSDSSDDESSDDKLERLFSNIKIQSAKKNARKHVPSRKSLSVFIVSDSEEIECISSDEEKELPKENVPPCSPQRTPLTTPTYSTPYTPYTGVVFWGSPDHLSPVSKPPRTTNEGKTIPKPPSRTHNFFSPLGDSSNCLSNRRVSVTTPSAGKTFVRFKNDMIQELYALFNSTVFNNKLPKDLSIIWNKKLRTTAGYCCYLGFGNDRTCRIELSTKVIDSYGRLRDTLVHEMCHAATWIIDGTKNAGHGAIWKQWADKAQAAHPGLRPVQRCHHYEIQYKYTYKCTVCDFKVGRHSKSVNLRTARCPYCLSTLELAPKLKSDGTPMVERKANRFAQFVKDHYSDVKSGSPWRSHKQVMEKITELYHSKPEHSLHIQQPEVGGAH